MVSEQAIERAKQFLVEDPSGWSRGEIAQHSAALERELRSILRDPKRFERYRQLCAEFAGGRLSAATFHDISLNVEPRERFHLGVGSGTC